MVSRDRRTIDDNWHARTTHSEYLSRGRTAADNAVTVVLGVAVTISRSLLCYLDVA
jgi:hypothetical protein